MAKRRRTNNLDALEMSVSGPRVKLFDVMAGSDQMIRDCLKPFEPPAFIRCRGFDVRLDQDKAADNARDALPLRVVEIDFAGRCSKLRIPIPETADRPGIFPMALVVRHPFQIARAFRAGRRYVRIVFENLRRVSGPNDAPAISKSNSLAALVRAPSHAGAQDLIAVSQITPPTAQSSGAIRQKIRSFRTLAYLGCPK